MNTVTQDMKFRQALILYSQKHGVTKAAIRYKTNRQYVYRWLKRYDGTIQSLADKSHRPHHHPNEHTADELKLIAFTQMGYTVLFVPETATELITGGVAPWTCGTNDDYQNEQKHICVYC